MLDLALWAERVCLVSLFAFLSDTLRGKPRCDALQRLQRINLGGDIGHVRRGTISSHPGHPARPHRRGVGCGIWWCLQRAPHQNSKRTGLITADARNTTSNTRRNDPPTRLTVTPRNPLYRGRSLFSVTRRVTRRSQAVRDPVVTYRILYAEGNAKKTRTATGFRVQPRWHIPPAYTSGALKGAETFQVRGRSGISR